MNIDNLKTVCNFCGERSLDTWNCEMKKYENIICSNCCSNLQLSKNKRNMCIKPQCAYCWNKKQVIRVLKSK